MPRTVCHIITMLELGGAQEVALFTVSHLDRARFRPVLLTGPGGILTEEAKALPGVTVELVPSLGRLIRPLRDFRALLELARLLRRFRPDIVHTHSSKAGILGRWAAWLTGVSVIVHTIHGYGITPSQPAWLRHLLIWLERLTGRITTRWIAVAEADIHTGLRWRLFDREHVSIGRPGIDPRPFQAPLPAGERDRVRAELGATPRDKLVGMVACLKPQKAPHDFVEVAARVCACMPGTRFALIGDGELREPVEAHIRSVKLEGCVRIVGWRRDIPDVMRSLDVFLLTSHWEGLARVLLEARAARLPIVATRVGGTAEVIRDGVNGYLLAAGDVSGLADRVLALLANPTLAADMGKRGEPLPPEFDIHDLVRRQEEEYERLLTGAKRRIP